MVKKEIVKKYCRMAIKNILYEGTTDVELFNKPFEIDLLTNKEFANELCCSITNSILTGKLSELKLHKLDNDCIQSTALPQKEALSI